MTADQPTAEEASTENPWPARLEESSKSIALVSSIFGLLGSTFGVLVAIAGDSIALVRERWEWLAVALALLGLGFTLLLIRLLSGPTGGDLRLGRRLLLRRDQLVARGVAALALAVGLALLAAITVQSLERRPSINASVVVAETGVQRLVGSVSSSGLRAADIVNVLVVGLKAPPLPPDGEAQSLDDRDATALSSFAVGAGSDGAVDLPLDVVLDHSLLEARVVAWITGAASVPHEYSPCWSVIEQSSGGCAEYIVADRENVEFRRPTLSASLEGAGAETILVASVAAEGLSADDSVFVRVYEPGLGGPSLYEAALAPESNGSVAHEVRLPIGAHEQVCVVALRARFEVGGARSLDDDEHLPIGRSFRCFDHGSAWAFVRVPADPARATDE